MKLISINCNKRLGSEVSRNKLISWLGKQKPELLLIPEPWQIASAGKVTLTGFEYLGGSNSLGAWSLLGTIPPNIVVATDFFNILEYPNHTVFSIYLNPYKKNVRKNQLIEISSALSRYVTKSIILLGDFNLAPTPNDGMIGENISKFNGLQDRGTLNIMMEQFGLVDLLSQTYSGTQEYSITRESSFGNQRFRVDLCLATKEVVQMGELIAKYDHSVREKVIGFTDHSGIVADLKMD